MIYKQFGHDQSGVHTHIILILDHTYMHMQTIGKSLKELKDYEGNVEELCYTFQVCKPWILNNKYKFLYVASSRLKFMHAVCLIQSA